MTSTKLTLLLTPLTLFITEEEIGKELTGDSTSKFVGEGGASRSSSDIWEERPASRISIWLEET